jgi:hypothetical protein
MPRLEKAGHHRCAQAGPRVDRVTIGVAGDRAEAFPGCDEESFIAEVQRAIAIA